MASKEKFAHTGDFEVYIPKASTDINSGDVVVMPRKWSPKSRSRLGTLGRISPMSSADAAPWVVGVVDSDFDTDTVGSTLYASPTSNQALPVFRRGVFKLAITNTSGNAGDFIAYSSGGTGAQLFAITQRAGLAIGVLEKTFSGATANDLQLVRLIPKDLYGPDIAYYLENRVINDCTVKPISGTSKSCVDIGYTGGNNANVFMIQGRRFRLARDTKFTFALSTGGAVSRMKAWLIVARSGGFGFRACSGYVDLTTRTRTGFSNALFVPTTQTSGELGIAYCIAHSAQRKYSAGMIFNFRGPVELPLGTYHWAL